MVEESCSHDIKVLNLKDGDFIRQSILFIHGQIDNRECFKLEKRPQIFLYNGTDCVSEFCEKEFKFILEFSVYETLKDDEIVEIELRFLYCTNQLLLKLNLEKPRCAFRLQPLYILCTDEDDILARIRCEQIDVNLRLVQAIYADRIREALGYPLTFVLNDVCKVFQSNITRKETWESDEHFLWNYFGEELLRKSYFGDGESVKLKIVAFIGCTKYDGEAAVASGDLSYQSIRKHLKGHAALGGGDFAIFGSGFFYAWPTRVDQIISCLRNTRKLDPSVEADESNYRRNYLGVYATTLGAVCHELGHIFDCGHTQHGIMGTGFDFLNRLLTITDHTENLPKRIIGKFPNIETKTASKSRLTNLNRISNEFLDSYREQRKNSGFYFTRNCAVILANNKWFMNIPTLKDAAEKSKITFDPLTGMIRCSCEALKIIEIRDNSNSLVQEYFELTESLNEFQLEKKRIEKFKETHYLYVLSEKGRSARFELNWSDKAN